MRKLNDSEIIGIKFNRITPIRFIGISKSRKRIFECLCDCGNITNVIISDIRNGHIKSCGCLNCRWVDQFVSDRNKRSNKFFTYNGETLIEKDWCRKLGIKAGGISKRIKSGWPIDQVFTLKNSRGKKLVKK